MPEHRNPLMVGTTGGEMLFPLMAIAYLNTVVNAMRGRELSKRDSRELRTLATGLAATLAHENTMQDRSRMIYQKDEATVSKGQAKGKKLPWYLQKRMHKRKANFSQ